MPGKQRRVVDLVPRARSSSVSQRSESPGSAGLQVAMAISSEPIVWLMLTAPARQPRMPTRMDLKPNTSDPFVPAYASENPPETASVPRAHLAVTDAVAPGPIRTRFSTR